MAIDCPGSAAETGDGFPKTLVVDLSLRYGGSTSRILALLQRFPREQVALAGLSGSAVVREALRLGLSVRTVGSRKADPRIFARLVRLVRQEGFEVLDSQNILAKLHASIAAARTRTALVSTINSWYASEHGTGSLRGRLYTAIELATNRRLSIYVTVSERDRQALLRSGVPRERIELIYNAVDVPSCATASEPEPLRRMLGLPKGTTLCVSVGRLVPVKGFDVLVEAARDACRRVPSLACVIIGDGEGRAELARRIRSAGLEGRVILAGHFERNAVLGALRSCHVFAMPSRYEGTPLALLEAAALARPIVASSAGGIPEMVTDAEQALLVPPGDPAALCDAIVRLCEDRSLAERLGRSAWQHTRARFSLSDQAIATREAHRKALLRHRSGPQDDTHPDA